MLHDPVEMAAESSARTDEREHEPRTSVSTMILPAWRPVFLPTCKEFMSGQEVESVTKTQRRVVSDEQVNKKVGRT